MNARIAALVCASLIVTVGCSSPEPKSSAASAAKSSGTATTLDATLSPAKLPTFKIENQRLVIPEPVTFQTGSHDLDESSGPTLDYVAQFMTARPDVTVLRVECHQSRDGDLAAAQRLTEQRALSVVRALVARGVDRKRLLAVGFGATKPVISGNTPDAKAANRRVEFAPAEMRGHAIGGMPLDGGGVVATED
ncbi:MAG: OmpA family protein [Planctomycetes bacterium]|nr:OmpA family protein [Planctomycetota bacterium]MBI3847126.1 OmpA family protein [Planctomycetota bacterium]